MIITIETDDLGRYVCTLDDGEARATVTASNVPDAAEQLSEAMDDVRETSYGEVIPPYDTVILDEAHLVEDVATQYFGLSVSSHRVDELLRDSL